MVSRSTDVVASPGVAGRWMAVVGGELFLLSALAALAFYQTFSFFALYDDLGYMMLVVKHVLAGQRLYDDVLTAYGPIYFLYKWLVHGLLGAALTHDVVGLNAIGARLATGVAAAIATFGVTGSLLLGAVAQILVTFHLVTIRWEPGHPQEIAGLLTMLMVALPCIAPVRSLTRLAVGLGLLAAALTMIKVNLGVFAVLAVWMALLSLAPSARASRALRVISSAGIVALPWPFMWTRMGVPAIQHFAATQTAALTALLLMARPQPGWSSGLRAPLVLIAAWAAGVMLTVLVMAFLGTSVPALVDSLILSPSRMPSVFFKMPPDYFGSALAGAVALALAVVVRATAGSRVGPHLVGLGKLAVGVAALVGSWRLDFRLLLSGVTPFIWLVLLTPEIALESDGRALARRILCWLAVLGPLQAFPIAGSQIFFGTVLHVVVGVVCLADALSWLQALFSPLMSRALRAVPAVMLLMLMASWMSQLLAGRTLYGENVAVDLPGTTLLRLPAGQAAELRAITEEVRERADTFITVPGFNSLYFWTGKNPPTSDVVSEVIQFYSDQRQGAMIDALLQHPRPVVVHWRGIAAAYPPFEALLQQHFKPLISVGWYQLLVPH